MIKKLFSLSENLFTMTAFLTFAFRSKCRVNKTTPGRKTEMKTHSPLRVVKKPRASQYSSAQLTAITKHFFNLNSSFFRQEL